MMRNNSYTLCSYTPLQIGWGGGATTTSSTTTTTQTTTTTIGVNKPDLIVTQLTGPNAGTIGGQINISVTVRNQGSANAGAFRVGFYFSTNSTIATNDTFSGWWCSSTGLSAGTTQTLCTGNIGVLNSIAPGAYYLGAIVDYLGQIAESNENNNTRSADTGTIVLTGITTTTTIATTTTTIGGNQPELIVTSLRGPTTGRVGAKIYVKTISKNQGSVNAGAFRVGFYFSTDSTITTGDARSSTYCNYSRGLYARRTGTCNGYVVIPTSLGPGTYYLGAIIDDSGRVAEGIENNNTRIADTGPIEIVLAYIYRELGPKRRIVDPVPIEITR